MSKITLGVRSEIIPYDFTSLGWKAIDIADFIHSAAYAALVDKQIAEVYPWTVRTHHVFLRNRLTKVGMILNIKKEAIGGLIGCGTYVKSEVYFVFREQLNIDLPQWNPELV